MEDIRPYIDKDAERESPAEKPAEWEAARVENDDTEPPFYLPRD